ncbi:MAG: SIMPL domain-containing protein [Gammaproteobacteria bacterium]|nr:SIMPL domain-containing protein [Gammaproteobacteria bacterium]
MAVNRWLILVFVFISAGSVNAESEIALLSVRGVAELKVPADQVEADLSIVSEAKTAMAALAESAKSTQLVIDALQALGLAKDEYRSGQFRIQPVWSARPKNPPVNWRREIVGFTVTSPLHIKSKQKDLIGELINKVVEVGVNRVNSVRFSLSDPRYYRQKAISVAAENAIEDAQTLALATRVKLMEVHALTIDDAAVSPVHIQRDQLSTRSFAKMESAVVPFNPGDVTVIARVSLSYRIKSAL